MSISESESPQAEPRRLITERSLIADFERSGLQPGMIVLMHSSLRALGGFVVGGAPTVIEALLHLLTPTGTLIVPAFSNDNTEPSYWQYPPVPEAWWDTIRAEWPPYRPAITVTRQMGLIVESFRSFPGVVRSRHPAISFAAWGKEASAIVADHPLDYPLGEGSPLQRIYERDGHVFLLGVGHGNNTSLHLAEYRTPWPGRDQIQSQSSAMLDEAGQRIRLTYVDIPGDDSDFPALGADYEAQTETVIIGQVAGATTRLMRQRPLVDFGVGWIATHRNAK